MGNSSSSPALTFPEIPNFTSEYSVVLPVNITQAYTIFGTISGHEKVTRLSGFTTAFALQERDEVVLPVPEFPNGKSLSESSLRLVPAASPNAEGRRFARQHFTLEETIPALRNLVKAKVTLEGTFTWDEAFESETREGPLEALYETKTDKGILIWKLRRFETTPGDTAKTILTERIEGYAPLSLLLFVKGEAAKAHRQHMDSYTTLLS